MKDGHKDRWSKTTKLMKPTINHHDNKWSKHRLPYSSTFFVVVVVDILVVMY